MGSAADASAPVRYETLRRLAVGGMGEVFLAREHGRMGFSRLVVIKRLLPQFASKRDFVEMFVDEARIIGHLNHPNICQILQLGEEGGVPFLALEYVRGDSLSGLWDRAIAADREIPRALTLRLLADTAWALHFAHEATDADGQPLNVIHRDISPHNVMVTFQGDVKLMDFGIARADNRSHRTDTGKVKGKVAYMAPEQLRGEPLDRRADVFAVGVMLWELTLSRRLFGGGSEVETLQKAVACNVPRPRSLDPSYPEQLEDIVMAALAPDRTTRLATAGELAQALQTQLAQLGGVERADIAALMRALYPVESKAPDDAPTTGDNPALAETDELSEALRVAPARSRPTESLHMADAPRALATSELRPTTPLRTPQQPSTSTTETVRPTAPRRSGGRYVVQALAIAALAAAGWAVVTRPWERDESSRPAAVPAAVPLAQPALQPPPQSPAVHEPASAPTSEPRTELQAVADVAPTPDVRAAQVPSKARPTQRIAKRPTGDNKPTPASTSHESVDKVAPAEPAAAGAPTTGVLAVASGQTAIVSIDGVRRKSTPYQTELPEGDHQVEVELAEGAGTLHTTAHVIAGVKTKCRVDAGRLSCASPR